MQLKDHLAALRRHWLLISVFGALGLVLAGGASLMATPQYTASSVVYFSLPSGSSGTDLQAGSTFAQSQVESYAQLATTPQVLKPVIKKNDLTQSVGALGGSLEVTVVHGTVMVSIAATNPSASEAAVIANGVANSLSKQVRELSPRSATGAPSVDATIVTKASDPKVPSSPHLKKNMAAGLLGGLLIGVVMALFREVTDTRVLTVEDVKELTPAPIIGQLGSKHTFRDATRSGVASVAGMEAIRRVRTNLGFLGVEQRPLAVAISSAMPGEGKSTVAVSLASALGDSGQSVLLIDADLRRPEVARMTDLDDAVGLTTVLIGHIGLDEAVQSWGDTGVDVLTAGDIPPNPSELLDSKGMEQLMKEAREKYDVIVIDTAPLVPVAETAVLARMISGYVMVVRAGAVRSGDLNEALAALHNVDGRVYGVVMNGMSDRDAAAYSYSSRAGSKRPPSAHARRRSRSRTAQSLGETRHRTASLGSVSGHAARVAD